MRKNAVGQRWFPGKKLQSHQAEIEDVIQLGDSSQYFLVILSVDMGKNEREYYQIPLRMSEEACREQSLMSFTVDFDGQDIYVSDALSDSLYQREILSFISDEKVFRSESGDLSYRTNEFFTGYPSKDRGYTTRVVSSEQSNSSVIYSDDLIYKSFRKLSSLPNPDYEVPYYLNRDSNGKVTPEPIAYSVYRSNRIIALAGILSFYVKDSNDAWKFFLESFLNGNPDVIEESGKIGLLTASMHNLLSRPTDDISFQPEPITEQDVASWKNEFLTLVNDTMKILSEVQDGKYIDGPGEVLGEQDVIAEAAELLEKLSTDGLMKIRIHGDYHLGQLLKTGSSYMVIDFEGEPARTPEYRRSKNCPVKDLGGMLRSLDYAAVLASIDKKRDNDIPELKKAAEKRLIDQYWNNHDRRRGYLPSERNEFESILKFFILEKAIYEVKYEALYRPEWLWIPARAVTDVGRNI